MISIARGAHRLFFAIAFTLIGIGGCSKHSPIDKIAAEISIAAYDIEGFHAALCREEYADG